MYTSFSIKNFRCFSSITLNRLKRINVILGKNNVGKTALLEALFLHVGPLNPTLTNTLNSFRGIPTARLSAEGVWSSIFHDFNMKKHIELTAVYPDKTKAILTITTLPASVLEIPRIEGEPVDRIITDIESIPKAGEGILYKYKHGAETKTVTMTIGKDRFIVDPPTISRNPFPAFIVPARIMLNPANFAERYGELEVKRLNHLIVETLQVIEPNLKSLSVIPLSGISIIHADIIGAPRLMPLRLAGEGLNRLAEISIDIVTSPKGIVLIDEIGSGMHFSVMTKLWTAIYQLAKKIGVQIFATTHSAECVESAHAVFKELKQYDIRYYRLQKIKDAIEVIPYDEEIMQAAIDTGLEVR